jgi:DNA-binding transcriptional ArsR family regulator
MTPGPQTPAGERLDRVFKALANAERRAILDALRGGPKATGELVMLFPSLSRFAVMQHLRVLARAGLVVQRKSGRIRSNFLNAVPIRWLYERWVSGYEGHWAGALTALKRRAEGGSARRGAVHPPLPGVPDRFRRSRP